MSFAKLPWSLFSYCCFANSVTLKLSNLHVHVTYVIFTLQFSYYSALGLSKPQ